MTLVCPIECEEFDTARNCVQHIVAEENPIDEVKFMNLRQSMNNGGGPACLRLRVVLNENQETKFQQGVLLTPELAEQLESWIHQHYRDELKPDDFAIQP